MGLVVLGAGGKLGRLIQPLWPDDAVWAYRQDIDITNPAHLADALAGARAVLCLAGVTPGSDTPMSENVRLARLTLDAAQTAGVPHVFLCSSAAVYGAQSGLLPETAPLKPRNAYGRAKADMEEMAVNHTQSNTILRIGNVAGVDAILGGWKPGFTLDQFADGTTPRRSYIGPQCLVQVLVALVASSGLPAILNIAAPGCVRMGALLDAAGFGWTPRAATKTAISDVCLDTSQLSQFHTFEPTDGTAAGIVADWRAAGAAS